LLFATPVQWIVVVVLVPVFVEILSYEKNKPYMMHTVFEENVAILKTNISSASTF
jgi:hypothetical protein